MAKDKMVTAGGREWDDIGRSVAHIAVIWQRFLPYHVARLTRLSHTLAGKGLRLTAVEVASSDNSYPFPTASLKEGVFEHVCCFSGSSYHDHTRNKIYRAVSSVLDRLGPDLVFAPATPFPEGMAAVAYRCRRSARVVMMDDAWEHTDRSTALTVFVKRRIHRNIDAVFVPAPSHRDYYRMMGFPEDRIVCGIDVVDNQFFSDTAAKVRLKEKEWRNLLSLPRRYFLFVGRFLRRKGIEELVNAYESYRHATENPWDLVFVGAGPDGDLIRKSAAHIRGIRIVGPEYDETLCCYYALAGALVVPSRSDPWGLVINEGMASGLPIIASRGCGAAKTLLREGENGWTFDYCNQTEFVALLDRMSSLQPESLRCMGNRSRSIVDEWCLDRFAQGVIDATQIPRRTHAGVVSDFFSKLWKGRVAVT
jgi:1,2-diacylglycerol 3-alpha-glucosyltransferase